MLTTDDLLTRQFDRTRYNEWWEKIKEYGLFPTERLAYSYYRARLITAWDVALRALRISVEYHPRWLLDACAGNTTYHYMAWNWALPTDWVLTLPHDWLLLRSSAYDPRTICPLSIILQDGDISTLWVAHNGNVSWLELENSTLLQTVCCAFIRNFFPLTDISYKRDITLEMANYIAQGCTGAETPLGRIQTSIVAALCWIMLDALAQGVRAEGTLYDEEFISALEPVLERKPALTNDLQMVKYLYQALEKENSLPLLSYLSATQHHEKYLQRWISAFQFTAYPQLAQLLI